MPTIPDSIQSVSEARAIARTQAVETERFQAGRVLTITAGHAVHDTYTAFLPPLLPVFIANLALSKTEAGLLTVFIQGPSLLQPFIGHLADRANLRHFVVLAPTVTAALMSLLGVAPGYAVLALFLIAVGLSSASLHSVGPVIAGTLSGQRLGRALANGLYMALNFGLRAGVVVVIGALGDLFGLRLAFITSAVISLLGLPLILLLPGKRNPPNDLMLTPAS